MGILAHGYTLLNQFQYHDDVAVPFSVGPTLRVGRWSNYILGKIFNLFLWSDTLSMSFFNGIIAIIVISLTAVFIIRILELKNNFLNCILAALCTSFPVVTTALGYRFMSHTYAIGVFLSVLGVYIITNENSNNSRLKVFIFFATEIFAIGIYQAVIPVYLSLITFHFVKYFIKNDLSHKEFFMKFTYLAILSVIPIILYLTLTLIFRALTGIEFSSYQGFDKLGTGGFLDWSKRFAKTYFMLLVPSKNQIGNIYPLSTIFFYYVLLIYSIFISLKFLLSLKGTKKFLQYVFMMLVLPLSINFIYIMCGVNSFVYTLMEFSLFFMFVYPCMLTEICLERKVSIGKNNIKFIVIILSVICFIYIYFANMCYVKADYLKSRAISYFTVLQARIQSTEGYSEKYPLVFAGESYKKSTESITLTEELQNIKIFPYMWSEVINSHSYKNFMKFWNGYSPVIYEIENERDLIKLDSETKNKIKDFTKNMWHYPDDGSIKVFENKIIVVNF